MNRHTDDTILDVGIVGYGLAGRVFHAPFIRDHPRLRVAAVVTRNPARARQANEDNPGVKIADDIESITKLVDLLIVASPPAHHFAHIQSALDSGLFVVVDKPFLPDTASAQKIVERASDRLTVFHNRRWDGDFLTIGSLIASGSLGNVFEFESAFEHWDPRPQQDWKLTTSVRDGGGVAMDLGSHLVDQAIQLFGVPLEVDADLSAVRSGAGNDDVSVIRLIHAGGVRSTLRMSRMGSQPLPRFRVSGLDRSCVVHGLDPQEGLLVAGVAVSDLASYQSGSLRTAELGPSAEGASASCVALQPGNYRELYDMIAMWALGRRPVPIELSSALATLAVLELTTAALR